MAVLVLPVVDAREMPSGGVEDMVTVVVVARWCTGRVSGLRECEACIRYGKEARFVALLVLRCC